MAELEVIQIETQPEPDACIIWMHGLGADGNDFVPLLPELKLPASARIRFMFPNAPVRPITINQGYQMRAWYDIISTDIVSDEDSEGIEVSSAMIAQLCHEQIDAGIAPERIILAGFSQGGAIALNCGLSLPLAGILALSCYLPQCAQDKLDIQFEPAPIFIGHGLHDDVVNIDRARSACRVLEQAGFSVEWHEYVMAHSLCPQEINDIRDWLLARLG